MRPDEGNASVTGADAHPVDVLVVGGGINGCGIARDAAGRGLDVLLVEAEDLGGATSSASTKLIHGGLRYLENYEFRLVREALMERERLQAAAPHIIWPLQFVLPHDRTIRPAWMVRLGLLLYDHLAVRKSLPGSRKVELTRHAFGVPLKSDFRTGFVYSDCWVQDSRLVVLSAMDARERGATVVVRTRLISARRGANGWDATLRDMDSGTERHVEARLLVNAGGPWVADILKGRLGVATTKNVRMVKGSHIVVRRLWDGPQAYIFQNPDKRIVFAIPYEGEFTLLGTTDVPFAGDPHGISIASDETRYICDSVNRCLAHAVAPADVVWSYAGVRPLFDDGASSASVTTRDYVFDLDAPEGAAPVLSVFGGKITTFRRLAEHAMEEIARFFPGRGPAWTATAVLPGGDIPGDDVEAFARDLVRRKPFLAPDVAMRLTRAYGTRVERVLGRAVRAADLGHDFGKGLTEAEVDYLVQAEWARSADDILWRRSKLGLHLPASSASELSRYLERRSPEGSPTLAARAASP